jgi:hypothetical protein
LPEFLNHSRSLRGEDYFFRRFSSKRTIDFFNNNRGWPRLYIKARKGRREPFIKKEEFLTFNNLKKEEQNEIDG